MIGQCECLTCGPISGGTSGGGSTGGGSGGGGNTSSGSGLNEIIPFINLSAVNVAWNATRKARFGDAGIFYVEILGSDGKYRQQPVEAVPDSISNTSQYTLDLGGPASGRVVIS